MISIAPHEAPVLIPLFLEVQQLCGQKDGDMDYVLSQLHDRIEKKTGAAFVDSIGAPAAVIIVVTSDGLTRPGKVAHVTLAYVKKEKRSPGLVEEMVALALSFAKEHKCYRFYGSSWDYMGVTAGIGSVWEKLGMEKQETIYSKLL